MLKNSKTQYGAIAKLLHWLSAFLIIGLFASGLWIENMGYYSPWYKTVPHYHKSVGILLIVIIICRLLWRLSNDQPEAESSLKPFDIKAAHIAHIVIYILLAIILIAGYLIPNGNNVDIAVFDWFSLPSLNLGIDNQEDIAGEIHEYAAFALIALIVVHILAALKHHFVNKNNTLRKILPFTRLNKPKEK